VPIFGPGRTFGARADVLAKPSTGPLTQGNILFSKAPPQWTPKPPESPLEQNSSPPIRTRDRVLVGDWSREIITVPKEVLIHLDLWNNDPSSFFRPNISQPDNPCTRIFLCLHQASGGDKAIQEIRMRIGQIGAHRLLERLELCKLYPGTSAEEEFAKLVQFTKNRDEIAKKAKKWATTGRKYDQLSAELGGLGSMICMPDDISRAK
jgi:hypothetical protein